MEFGIESSSGMRWSALVVTSARRVLSPEQPRQVLGPKSTVTGDGPVRQAGRPCSGATHRGWLRTSPQVVAGMSAENPMRGAVGLACCDAKPCGGGRRDCAFARGGSGDASAGTQRHRIQRALGASCTVVPVFATELRQHNCVLGLRIDKASRSALRFSPLPQDCLTRLAPAAISCPRFRL